MHMKYGIMKMYDIIKLRWWWGGWAFILGFWNEGNLNKELDSEKFLVLWKQAFISKSLTKKQKHLNTNSFKTASSTTMCKKPILTQGSEYESITGCVSQK